jgi:hypothetical protein
MSDESDKALSVIGKKLEIKEVIDKDFDEKELINQNFKVAKNKTTEPVTQIKYKIDTKNIGFNVLCDLNLGKAYQYTETELPRRDFELQKDLREVNKALKERDEDPITLEEAIKEKLIDKNYIKIDRKKYPSTYKEKLDENWLDFMLKQIAEASNPIVVISDIFSRRTTGNYQEVMPYSEQLSYIYNKLKDDRIKDKIVVLARGLREREIMLNGGPDLMLKLGKMLGLEDRVLDGGFILNADLDNIYEKGKSNNISFAHVNRKINSRKTAIQVMKAFSTDHPGNDVYFCTNAKQNWWSAGVTTYKDPKTGKTSQKTCWYLCFGPCYEYDKFNANRPELGPYTLNNNWYKIYTDEKQNVKVEFTDYIFPKESKLDISNYVATVVSSNYEKLQKNAIKDINSILSNVVMDQSIQTKKQVKSSIQEVKNVAKQFAKLNADSPKGKDSKDNGGKQDE